MLPAEDEKNEDELHVYEPAPSGGSALLLWVVVLVVAFYAVLILRACMHLLGKI